MTMIAIITRRRLNQLETLLDRLAKFYGKDSSVRIAVVDNDDQGSARPVVERHRHRFVGGMVYEVESTLGYSSARNRVVALMEKDDYLAFIDDDEIPDAGWLEALLRASRDFSADVVAGLVVAEPTDNTSESIVLSGVLDAQHDQQRRAGETMKWCATNNTLVHRTVFERLPDGFDIRFNRCGGEDSHFFMRASQAGFRIVWAPDAIVREPLEPSRLQPAWHLARARHVGRLWISLDLELRRNPRVLLRRAAEFGHAVGRGMLLLISGCIRRDDASRLRGRYQLALATGMAEALLPSRRY